MFVSSCNNNDIRIDAIRKINDELVSSCNLYNQINEWTCRDSSSGTFMYVYNTSELICNKIDSFEIIGKINISDIQYLFKSLTDTCIKVIDNSRCNNDFKEWVEDTYNKSGIYELDNENFSLEIIKNSVLNITLRFLFFKQTFDINSYIDLNKSRVVVQQNKINIKPNDTIKISAYITHYDSSLNILDYKLYNINERESISWNNDHLILFTEKSTKSKNSFRNGHITLKTRTGYNVLLPFKLVVYEFE